VWELRWGLGESLESLVGHGASGVGSSPAAPMADDGRLLCCSGARKERQGRVFIGQQRSKAVSPELRWPQWQRHGRGGGGDVRPAGGQWQKAVRAAASVERPRGTGLGC
jgi:hypothetical protein